MSKAIQAIQDAIVDLDGRVGRLEGGTCRCKRFDFHLFGGSGKTVIYERTCQDCGETRAEPVRSDSRAPGSPSGMGWDQVKRAIAQITGWAW